MTAGKDKAIGSQQYHEEMAKRRTFRAHLSFDKLAACRAHEDHYPKRTTGEEMKAGELRSAQGPLKDRYRREPEAALVTLRAQGRLGEGITCKVETGKALVEAGLHPATGGSGVSACSGDMLLEALAACAGVTLGAVATSLGIGIREGIIRTEGDLDFRGTLGVSREVPVGFQKIRLHFDLETDASNEQLETLLRLTERYCVVYQTLRLSPQITISRTIVEPRPESTR